MATTNQMNINGSNPVTVGGTGITAKYFPQPSSNFTAGAATTPSATSAVGQLAVHTDNQFNGQQFSILATGNFAVGPGGACPSFKIELVANTGTVASPTYTVIASTGNVSAQTNLNVFYPWQIEAVLNGDTQSGTISGYQISVVDNTVSAPAALTNVLSGLNFFSGISSSTAPVSGIGLPVFGVVVRATFSVSEPGNIANMFEFNIQN